jgi:hypothetical protein
MGLSVSDFYEVSNPDDKKGAMGVLEIIVKDKAGRVVEHHIEKNIIKIFAKEMLAHRLPSSQIWNPDANGGLGEWEDSNADPDNEFSARYILLGASFDENGTPLGTNDTRYYTQDPVTGQFVPVRLTPAADNGGGLINAIPIAESDRPLKRVESIDFQSTYQPTGSPLISGDVRAINNILVVETVLPTSEYNGFSGEEGDFFTITEVCLAGGRTFDGVAQCGLVPRDLFLQGVSDDPTGSTTGSETFERAVVAVTNGTNTISISSDESAAAVSIFKKGDQIKIVNEGGTQEEYDNLDQINSHYLVTDTSGGRDLVLDRVPTDNNGQVLSGNIGIFRDTLKLFSQRILSTPVQKSSSFEITIRWSIIFN